MKEMSELKQFMQQSSRIDLKVVSVTHILSLTGSPEGITLISGDAELLRFLVALAADDTAEVVRKDSALALVNLSAASPQSLFEANSSAKTKGLVQLCLQNITDENCPIADAFSMVLSNISRPESLVDQVIDELLPGDLEKLVACFTKISYNKKKCHLDYLGPIFSNFTQSAKGRNLICQRNLRMFQRILPFVHHEGSIKRRGGAVGVIKNVCFDTSLHEWLFSNDVDVLPYILLPLAGGEEFDDETNDMLPSELQYLEPTKQREEDVDIRKMLLESLSQLSATRDGRTYLRSKGTYEILRELHKFECGKDGDKQTLQCCENVVDVLIRTEDEIGQDNLKKVDVPEDMMEKIQKIIDDEQS